MKRYLLILLLCPIVSLGMQSQDNYTPSAPPLYDPPPPYTTISPPLPPISPEYTALAQDRSNDECPPVNLSGSKEQSKKQEIAGKKRSKKKKYCLLCCCISCLCCLSLCCGNPSKDIDTTH